MDIGAGARRHRYESLNPALLPPLVIVWREDMAAGSGRVHESLRARHRRREPAVQAAMAALAEAAREARDALLAEDRDRFACAVDKTVDVRARILELDPRCVEMLEVARAEGASANYTGSAGAIVAVCRDEPHRETVRARLGEVAAAIGMEERPPNLTP